MANLTITIDDDLLHEARVRAVREGTSVNALLRAHLVRYVGQEERNRQLAEAFRKSAAEFVALQQAERSTRTSAHGEPVPASRRDAYYAERMERLCRIVDK